MQANPADHSKDKLLWKWIKGQATTLAELGNPTATTDYALCVYDANGVITHVGVPSSASLWAAAGSNGFKYSDTTLCHDGAQTVVLKSGGADKTKAIVKGKGVNLPAPPLGALTLPVTAQLVNGTVCLGVQFDTPHVVKNDASQFKAKKEPRSGARRSEFLRGEVFLALPRVSPVRTARTCRYHAFPRYQG